MPLRGRGRRSLGLLRPAVTQSPHMPSTVDPVGLLWPGSVVVAVG